MLTTFRRKLAHDQRSRYKTNVMRVKLLVLVAGVAVAGFAASKKRSTSPALSASLAGSSLYQPRNRNAESTATMTGPLRPDLSGVQRIGDHYEAPLLDGRRAILTLEPALQEQAEALLIQAAAPRGAVVAMRIDGTIVALAGQRMEADGDVEFAAVADGVSDANVATETWAPSASVFKLVTSVALLKNGVRADDKVCFHGGLRSVVANNLVDSKSDSTCESLTFGVAHSQNAILGKLAYQHLQLADLRAAAEALGYGVASAPQLPGNGGQLSLSAEHDLLFAQNAAGFSGSRLSALGGAQLANTIASNGLRVTPHIVRTVIESDGSHTEIAHGETVRTVPADVAKAVAGMMKQTCEIGSASRSFRRRAGFPQQLTAAGKTGTLSGNDPFPMQFSWFVGFAPAERPELSISVVLGNSESWRLKGHMIAASMIERAFAHDGAMSAQTSRRVQW
jgi:penicillin-binding protein A